MHIWLTHVTMAAIAVVGRSVVSKVSSLKAPTHAQACNKNTQISALLIWNEGNLPMMVRLPSQMYGYAEMSHGVTSSQNRVRHTGDSESMLCAIIFKRILFYDRFIYTE